MINESAEITDLREYCMNYAARYFQHHARLPANIPLHPDDWDSHRDEIVMMGFCCAGFEIVKATVMHELQNK